MGPASRPANRAARWFARPATVAVCLSLLAGAGIAAAATLNERFSQGQPAKPGVKDRMVLNAREMIYDRDKDVVEARGEVQIYYQGRILQADHVRYDRKAERVFAEGHAKMTERDGTVGYGDRFELTDDFKDGFIDSLKADSADSTHFTAARAERTGGETTVLDRGTYTACDACKDDPSKPPLWQVRAKRIIHQNDEQTVYYEDAYLEFYGVPIAYIPYLSMADPTVTRKSGILAPHYVANTKLGVGVGIPIFWAIAPNYDLTVTPTLYTRQGLFLQSEWRQRLANGSYSIRASGIFQNDSNAFLLPPNGAGARDLRGSFDSYGQFYINEKWKVGWDVTLLSDKWFLTDYRLPTDNLSQNYFKEATSTIYLNGQGDRGYFDLRGYYFQGLGRYDLQQQQPLVGVFDYNKTFDLKPQNTFGIGGQVELDVNATYISRQLASFQSTGARTLDSLYNLYDVCKTPVGQTLYTNANCLVHGIGGDYMRLTGNVSWKRQFIDPVGQVWTPFAFTHINGAVLNLDTSQAKYFGTSIVSNASQANFFGAQGNSWVGNITPGVGLEYRFPFVASTGWATHVFEPIAQIIARPNESVNSALVNEDSQSLVFDDTNLFQWNKFSGYDRFEGGTRINYGGQYTMTFQKGGYVNLMAGQSFQLAGKNSYATPDAANIGLSSGLDNRASDFVTRVAIAPTSQIAFIAKGRFDPLSYSLRRIDALATAKFSSFETTLQYARYQAQPLIGFDKRREGLSAAVKYKFNTNYFISSNVIFDLTRHLYNSDPQVGGHAGLFSLAGVGLGAGYIDECTTFSINYTSVYEDKGTGTPVRNQTVLFQLELRTLGDTRVSSGLGDIKMQDGLGTR